MANAKGVELASAYISLSVSTKGIPQQVKNVLRGVGDVDVDVDANTAGATANMARWRKGQEKNAVNVKVDVDTKAARSQVRELSRSMESLRRSDLFKISVGVAGVASLPALAAGLAEVASAMQQVAQASLAIPGGVAGAVSSIGTLAFGLSGVSDAYDALTKASDEAATSGSDQAAQARAATSASNNLRNAVVDETQARKDVARATRDARNELMDLNVEMRGGVLSEKRAVLEAQKAREDLMSGKFTDIRDAMLRVEEADQRVIETRVRNAQRAEEVNDANAKGVEGSDQVVAANERLIRSQQQVGEAEAGVAAAAESATAAQEAAALAMSKLSPNAQEFARTMMDLKGPIMELRNLVQDNIFSGMASQLKGLTTRLMPNLEKGLGAISEAWNENFNELFDVLGKDENVGLLDRIFGNTAEAQSILTDTIEPIVEAVGTLAAAGSDSLPRLADAFVDVAERFSNFITEADQDGRLQQWIDEGITAMGNLGEIALNVGKMFTAIGTAASDGKPLLQTIEELTTKWQQFLNSAEGQQTLKDLFAEGKRVWEQWQPVLTSLPGILRGVYDGAAEFAGLMSEIFGPIASFLKEHPALVKTAVEAYLLFKGAQVLGAIGSFTQKLLGIGGALDVIPGKADKAAKGVTNKLGPGTVANAALAAYLLWENKEEFQEGIGVKPWDPDPQKQGWVRTLFGDAGVWIESLLTGDTPEPGTGFGGAPGSGDKGMQPGAPGVPFDPNSPNQSGNNPLDVFTGANPDNQNTNGALMPATASIETYLRDTLQFQGEIGGWRQPDGFNEHSSGKALDVMVGGPEQGYSLLPNMLTRPGVEYVLWDQKQWYPDGSSKPMSDRGSPTQNHMDHLHVKTFDEGGWLPPGMTLTNNATGQPELILNPDQIAQLGQSGIDPNTLLNGGQPGMPTDLAGIEQQFGFGSQPTDRTEGYIPAAAGNTDPVAGGGLFGGLINMGSEALQGAIQAAADLGKMAASAAASAGTFGAGAAAGPAAGAGIQIGADIAKRGVQWGAEMLNIGIGAASEILFPFGPPRWLNDVSPMSFMPQNAIQSAAVTSGEKAIQDVYNQRYGVDPATTQHGTGMGAPPGPETPPGVQPATHGVNPAAPGPPTAGAAVNPPKPNPSDPLNFIKTLTGGIFDQGGQLQPGTAAINMSNRPEYVLTGSQWKAMEANASQTVEGRNVNYYITAANLDEALRETKKKERRESRQYSGRP